jgi:GTPase
MNYRLQEGHGIAYYKIGVEDSGFANIILFEEPSWTEVRGYVEFSLDSVLNGVIVES